MQFKKWLESVESLNIPKMQPNMYRLTHFTAASPESFFKNGLDISEGQLLDSTVDSFSSDEQVYQTIQSGFMGSMNRSYFGNYVILIDLPKEIYEFIRGVSNWTDKRNIPSSQILGYVDRNDMSFHKNPLYNPTEMKKPETSPEFLAKQNNRGMGGDDEAGAPTQIAAPAVNSQDDLVW